MTAGGRRDRRGWGWGWHSPSLLGCTNTDSGRKVPGKKNNRKRYRAPPLSETFHHCRCLSARKKPKSHLGESPLACSALLCPVQPTQQQPGLCQPLWSRRVKKHTQKKTLGRCQQLHIWLVYHSHSGTALHLLLLLPPSRLSWRGRSLRSRSQPRGQPFPQL